jgi:hypothetical protein
MSDEEAYTSEIIHAEPEKRFFIEILTRDIGLIPAIVELVDNSVDSARELRPQGDYTGLEVEIEAKPDSFWVQDNCGGISLNDAREYVFKIGRPSSSERADGSIGQFGVGMKRALFKMGAEFAVQSTTTVSRFTLELDVRKWEMAPGWDLELKVADPPKSGYKDTGTLVIINRLLPVVVAAFKEPLFETRLRNEIESKHRDAIDKGLQIVVNGRSLRGTPTQLAVSADLVPGFKRFKLRDEEGRQISVEILVGVLPASRTLEDAAPEDVEAAEREGGWYVFGNGRLLLDADKTEVTGWMGGKSNMPLWHNQYSRFRGYVYMDAKEPEALPWNTTKTGVETSDQVWLKVRGEMIKQGAAVIRMLTALKNERATGSPENLPITRALKGATTTTVGEISKGAESTFIFPKPVAPKPSTRDRRIAYTVPVRDFDLVASELDTSDAGEVGKGTFYSYLRRYVELSDE